MSQSPHWIQLFAAITAISTAGFVIVTILWLRRLRDTTSSALAEAAHHQVRTAQRTAETLAEVQKQQKNYEQQIHMLVQANAQLRQGLVNVATRLDSTHTDTARSDQTLH